MIVITFDCRAVHSTGSDAGFSFTSIDGAECYDHFKNLLAMNSPDPALHLAELRENPGIIAIG
ncbi:MAG: hypothetical protein E4G96_03730 [Chrysiogenales bacterium]|nr:MAG: hypothetical protein E4G96_03730 [Chrysiogenales bacterium]